MTGHKIGKIYAIRSHVSREVYIGSTIQSLNIRISEHRSRFKSYLNGEHNYISSFELIKYEDHYIELIESYEYSNRRELHKREGEIMISSENCVNKNIAGRDSKQWYRDNITTVKKQKGVKYNCECGGKYTHTHKAHHEKTNKHTRWLES